MRQLTLQHFEAPTNRILDDILFAYRIVASPSTLITIILARLRREPEKQSAYLEVGRRSTAYLFASTLPSHYICTAATPQLINSASLPLPPRYVLL